MTGSGTENDPYIISDVNDLQDMEDDLDAYYELGGDIDASATSSWNGGLGFDPIDGFTGSFDGNYYAITGLYINRTSGNVGLFGSMSTGSPVIQNLYILDAYISSIHSSKVHCNGGILIGASYEDANPQVSRVLVSGEVYAYHTEPWGSPHHAAHAGGLIGFLWEGNAHITECASYANVTAVQDGYGYSYAGGLIGGFGTWYGSSAYVRNCYARGDVYAEIGDHYSGKAAGFIGFQHTSGSGGCLIQKSYSTGHVDGIDVSLRGFLGYTDYPSETTDCFWDIQTSGQTSSAGTGAVGKNTASMKTESTFTDAGWNFVSTWKMLTNVNDGYPHFLREHLGQSAYSNLRGLFARGNEIQVVFALGNCYRSPDFGDTWYPMSGLPSTAYDVAFDEDDTTNSVVGCDGCLYVYSGAVGDVYYYKQGATVTGQVVRMDADISSDVCVIATNSAVYKTTDWGYTAYKWLEQPAPAGVAIGGSALATSGEA